MVSFSGVFLGLLYLLQEHAIKSKKHGFFFRRLPSLELLDTTGYACILTGFAMLTFGLITGFVYAKVVWGKFWSWDPKEIWSGITWLLYAALLHQRLSGHYGNHRFCDYSIYFPGRQLSFAGASRRIYPNVNGELCALHCTF